LPLPLHEWNGNAQFPRSNVLNRSLSNFIQTQFMRAVMLAFVVFVPNFILTKDPEHFAFTMCESAVQP